MHRRPRLAVLSRRVLGRLVSPHRTLSRAAARNGAATAKNSAGPQENGISPERRTSNRAPGIAATVDRPSRIGIAVSFDPQITKHGAVIRSARGRRSYSRAAKLRHIDAVSNTPSGVFARASARFCTALSLSLDAFM